MGSSPLARGLPSCQVPTWAPTGIIPARAGFTRRRSAVTAVSPDHPRSRGVYLDADGHTDETRGSSPLARGLRVPIHPDRLERRIIPARAGFTGREFSRHCRERDHPRSRGVYIHLGVEDPATAGSSPLARGLHGVNGWPIAQRGIIPARAGFTSSSMRVHAWSADHPRSRGVYIAALSDADRLLGSSPLARGLHLRIPGIPTMSHATRPRLPSVLA